MALLGDIKCAECGGTFWGNVSSTNKICPKCIHENHGGREAVEELLKRLQETTHICYFCGKENFNSYFYNGIGFCCEDHMKQWYKIETGKDFPNITYMKIIAEDSNGIH